MDQKNTQRLDKGYKIEISYSGTPYEGYTYDLTKDAEVQEIIPSDKFRLYLVYTNGRWNIRLDSLGENTITNRVSGWVDLKNYGIFYLKKLRKDENIIDLRYSDNIHSSILRIFTISTKEKPWEALYSKIYN